MSQRSARMIRHAIRNSPRFARASWRERDFYYGLLTIADDLGRFDATPAILRAGLYAPMLQKVSERDVKEMLARCQALGLVKLYAIGGQGYGQVMRYDQKMAKKQPLYPAPDDEPELDLGTPEPPRAPRLKERKKEIPPNPPPSGGPDLPTFSPQTSRRTVSPRRELQAARAELESNGEELRAILRPGGCAYNVTPTGEKLERYNALLARRTTLEQRIEQLQKAEAA